MCIFGICYHHSHHLVSLAAEVSFITTLLHYESTNDLIKCYHKKDLTFMSDKIFIFGYDPLSSLIPSSIIFADLRSIVLFFISRINERLHRFIQNWSLQLQQTENVSERHVQFSLFLFKWLRRETLKKPRLGLFSSRPINV